MEFFKEMSPEEILSQRKNKFLKIGRDKGFIDNTENLSQIKNKTNNINQLFENKKNIYYLVGSIF